jgi:hypothetical protein
MSYPRNDRHLGGINFSRNAHETARHAQWEAIYAEIKRGVVQNLDPRHGIFSLDALLLEHAADPNKWFNWLSREQFDWLKQNEAFCRHTRQQQWYRLLVLPEIPYIANAEERKGTFLRMLTYVHTHLWHGIVAGVVFVNVNHRFAKGFNPSDFNSVAIPGARLMYYIPAYYRAESVGCMTLTDSDAVARLSQVKRGLNLSEKNVIWLRYDQCNFIDERLPAMRWQALRSFFAGLYRNNRICEVCTQPFTDFELDHIMPLSARYPQTIINFRPVHKSCNWSKRAKMPPANPFQVPPFIPQEFQTARLMDLFDKGERPGWIREVSVVAGTNGIITSLALNDV